MTGPEGDQHRGFWDVDEVQPPHRLVFRDGFADEDGTPNTELPTTTARVTIQDIGGGKTRMSIESEFPTVEAMEQLRHGRGGRPDTGGGPDRRDPGRGSGLASLIDQTNERGTRP